MKDPIPINLAVEDILSEAALRLIINQSKQPFAIGACYMHQGFGYLKRTVKGFNNAAKGTPFILLTDLDKTECPPLLMKDWLDVPKHPNLLFRVAVRQVEAWLLAHREGVARFVGIKTGLVPKKVDEIENAKRCLIKLVEKSRRRDLREDIVPAKGSTMQQGPNYNGRLIKFLNEQWNIKEAIRNSQSLERTVRALDKFRPAW